jgi:hypothetical protein
MTRSSNVHTESRVKQKVVAGAISGGHYRKHLQFADQGPAAQQRPSSAYLLRTEVTEVNLQGHLASSMACWVTAEQWRPGVACTGENVHEYHRPGVPKRVLGEWRGDLKCQR